MQAKISFARALVATSALALTLAGAAPAFALDDGQDSILGSVMNLISLDPPKSNDDIAYRERPPLVLPPKMQLRPPQANAAERSQAWPQDADLVKRKKELDSERASLLDTFVGRKDRTLRAEELKNVKSPAVAPHKLDTCDNNPEKGNCQRVTWESLAGQQFTSPDGSSNTAIGQEPPRRSLTDPPKGYRVVTKEVKERQIAPEDQRSSPLSFFSPTPKPQE